MTTLRSSLLCASALTVTMILAGCGAGSAPKFAAGSTASPAVIVAPSVVSVGEQVNGVAPNRIQDVQFNQSMDASTINSRTFQIADGSGAAVPGMVTYNPTYQVASFKPVPALKVNATYTATITTGVASDQGVHMARNYTYNFTTRPTTDTSPLYVASVTPQPNATCVSTSTPITISFSEGVDVATLNSTNIVISTGGAGNIPAQISYSVGNSMATLTPNAPLPQGTITVTVQGVADLADVPMASTYAFSFQTTPCNTTGEAVITTIPVIPGGGPSLAIDTGAGKVYVGTGNNIQVIDETTNTVVDTISVPNDATVYAVAVDPATARLYVAYLASSGSNSLVSGLFVYDTGTLSLVGNISNIPFASGVAVNPSTNMIYVSDFNSLLYVVDGATNSVVTTLSLNAIENLAVDPSTNRIYVAEENIPGKVAVVDGATNQVIATAAAGGGMTFAVAVNPGPNLIYTADPSGSVSVIDGATNTLKATIPVPGQPALVAVDPINGRIYVSDSTLNDIQIIDSTTNLVTGTVPVGPSPGYMAIDPGRNLLYVGNDNGTISVVSTL